MTKGIILGVDLWIMDEGTAYPPPVTYGDPFLPNFGKPIPGRMAESFSIIKAGTRIYLKPPECRCQCPKNSQESGTLTGQKKHSSAVSGRVARSKK